MKPRLLMASAERWDCARIAQICVRLGYHIDVVRDAHSALALVGEHHYGMAIVDADLPGAEAFALNGLATSLRERVFAVVLLAPKTSELAAKARRDEAWRVVEKPFDDGALLPLIEQARVLWGKKEMECVDCSRLTPWFHRDHLLYFCSSACLKNFGAPAG